MLWCVAVYWSVMQCARQSPMSVLQHVAVCNGVLRCVASVLKCARHSPMSVLQHVAVCCAVLQCVAVCCSVLDSLQEVCCSML